MVRPPQWRDQSTDLSCAPFIHASVRDNETNFVPRASGLHAALWAVCSGRQGNNLQAGGDASGRVHGRACKLAESVSGRGRQH
eukprot:2265286-Alexandrium_andersonii.AAC.1